MTAPEYDHQAIEQRWQDHWEAGGLYRSRVDWGKPKHYALTMLPYPSGNLHIGHWYAMTPSDARARMMRMKGFNVLFPMGFDAFGLPAENAAVQRNIHPSIWTNTNIDHMRAQLRSMGAMFDWEREAISCDPSYYEWTEWFFKKFFESDIAYRGEAMVNWSPTLQTVLANEQVIDGKDERTGQPVTQKLMSQWFFAITKYAEELLEYPSLDWPTPIKTMQRNWIGRSEGTRVIFLSEGDATIEVFTTRPDTLWGATFMVLAPEHKMVPTLTTEAERDRVEAYRETASHRTELERLDTNQNKTGVFTGSHVINPANGEEIPVWIADYVLLSYGTGAIMAVPAHDQRDFEFARQFNLKITPVIQPEGARPLRSEEMREAYVGPGTMINSAPIDGLIANTKKGRENPAISGAIDWLKEHGAGEEAVNYRLRDWLISRQRYWGAPIPVLYREDNTIEAAKDIDLPVLLPADVAFAPTGKSPLANHDSFLHTVDSSGQPARRETDTMDTFMCSSWYQYRYLSPNYRDAPFDPDEAAYWLPVDVYTGGAEHATMHLLYTRFFTKAMRDLGLFDDTAAVMQANGRDPAMLFDEPMVTLRNQGQVLGEEQPGDFLVLNGSWHNDRLVATSIHVDPTASSTEGLIAGELFRRTERTLQIATGNDLITVEVENDATINIPAIPGKNNINQLKHHLEVQRMSKTRGNTVNPDQLVQQYGADTVRAHLMFAYDWEKGGPWDSRGILGARRFIEDVWRITHTPYTATKVSSAASTALRQRTHQTIQKVEADMLAFKWNTAVAALMTMRNDMTAATRVRNVSYEAWDEALETLLLLLAPIAPHITDELWHALGNTTSIHLARWPTADLKIAHKAMVTMVIQVNGKVRDRIEVAAEISAEDATAAALEADRIKSWVSEGQVLRVVARPPNLVNIVLT